MHNVISVISQKGGVGKSTVTTLLANIFYLNFKHSVAIIDADYPQNSIGKTRESELRLMKKNVRKKNKYDDLYSEREPYPIYKTNLMVCNEKIDEIKNDYDFIFVDVTGSINQQGISQFLSRVNHFFIPVLQDNFSIRSALELYEILKKVESISTEYRSCKLFFNRLPSPNRLKRILNELGSGFEILENNLGAYVDYEDSFRTTLYKIPERNNNSSAKIFEFASKVRESVILSNKPFLLSE